MQGVMRNSAFPMAPPCAIGHDGAMRIHGPSLAYFDAVRRAGSIREASRRLNVASSAVNRQILKLEAEIGTPLFERFPGGMRLTAAGEALARHAILVAQDLERARAEIDALKGARTGHVSVAAAEGACSDLLVGAVAILGRQAPRVTVAVRRVGSLAVPDLVAEGEADLGLGFDLPRQARLRPVVIGRFRLGAVMAPDHPLAGRASVTLAACLEHPVMLAMPDLSIQNLIAPALARLGPRPAPALQSNSVELMRELAARGGGIAFQVRVGLERILSEGRAVHVPLDVSGPVVSELGLWVRAERSLPPAVDLLARIVGEEIRRREADEPA